MTATARKILIHGAAGADALPGLLPLPVGVEPVFSNSPEALAEYLPDAEILLGWDPRQRALERFWGRAHQLRWIHWCGAGVDAVLGAGLRANDVILTNAGGVFDRAMAETVLGYMIFEAKDFRTTLHHQQARTWEYRMSHQLLGDRALIVGVGSIGRAIARVLRAFDIVVHGVGRRERVAHEDFDRVYAAADIRAVLPQFNWVIGVLPATPQTEGFFDAGFFAAMKAEARFINVGRGSAVVEADLVDALTRRRIAGAFLDVFRQEPLAENSPLWALDNVFISPHISGDYTGFEAEIVNRFKSNLERYLKGEPLLSVVDKNLGFVRARF